MKKICLLMLFTINLCTINAQENDSLQCRKIIEKYIPLYIIDNYCSKHGWINILNSAIVDDRVLGIIKDKGDLLSDSVIYIKYKTCLIEFYKTSNIPYLENFTVNFHTKLQMDNFEECYAKILGFSGVGITGKRNSVVGNTEPSNNTNGLPYSATCFVYQWGFCK